MSTPSTEHAAANDPTPCKVDEMPASAHRFPPRLGDCLFVRQDSTLGLPGQVTYPNADLLASVGPALRCPNGCDLRTYGTHADDCPLEPNDRDRTPVPASDLQDVTRLPRHVLPGEGLTGEQLAKLWDDTTPANERGGSDVAWVPRHEGRTDPTTGLFQGISLTGPVHGDVGPRGPDDPAWQRHERPERHLTIAGASDAPPEQDPAATPAEVSSVPTAAVEELVEKAAELARWVGQEFGGADKWADYRDVREIAARLGVELEEKP